MLKNKLYGCLLGYAVGNALGLGTEFMTRAEVQRRYPGGLRSYSQFIRDAHRSQWRRGDYTADTEIIIELIESLMEVEAIDYMDYARRLQNWYNRTDGADVGSHIRNTISRKDFAERPHEICYQNYSAQAVHEAYNECLGRAMVIGLMPQYTEDDVKNNTRLTHWDPRCVAASSVIACVSHNLLWNDESPTLEELKDVGDHIDRRVSPYIEKAFTGELDDFELDDKLNYWFARKAMGSALWELIHSEDPEKALYNIIDRGGDADTNAALTMGLLGLKYGANAVPKSLLDTLLEREKMEDIVERFSTFLEKQIQKQKTEA